MIKIITLFVTAGLLSLVVIHLGKTFAMRARLTPAFSSKAKATAEETNDLSSKKQVARTLLIGLGVTVGLTVFLVSVVVLSQWAPVLVLIRWVAKFVDGHVVALLWGLVLVLPTLGARWRLKLNNLQFVCFITIVFSSYIGWLVFQNWLTVDAFAMVTGIVGLYMTQPRVSFLKGWLVLMVASVLYDCVQVFGTGYMDTLALGSMGHLAPGSHSSGLTLPFLLVVPQHLGLDSKAAFMLGMGDVMTSGLLIILAARIGQRVGSRAFYPAAVAGFVIGDVIADITMLFARISLPATIFLFPAIGGMVALVAWRKGVLPELKVKAYSPDMIDRYPSEKRSEKAAA